MLGMVDQHVDVSTHERQCQGLLTRIRQHGNRVDHSTLLKASRLDAKTFGSLINTLAQRNDIHVSEVPTKGRKRVEYSTGGGA